MGQVQWKINLEIRHLLFQHEQLDKAMVYENSVSTPLVSLDNHMIYYMGVGNGACSD